jgi:hypothetical protein
MEIIGSQSLITIQIRGPFVISRGQFANFTHRDAIQFGVLIGGNGSTCGAYWTRPSYPDVLWWSTNRPIYIILREPVLQWTLWIDPHPILVSCCSRPAVSAHVVSFANEPGM